MRKCLKEGTATRRRIWQVLIVVCLFFSFSSLAIAQSATADIVGTVTDPAGAVVVNGTVTNTSVATGLVQKVSLNETGSFTFTLLPVGSYTVSIQAPGFKTYVTRVTVAAGDRARISAQITLGQTEQTVTVEGVAAALQTDESTIGSLITSEATQDLPLNGRNVTNLVTLAAGVTGGLPSAMNSGTRPDDRRQTSSFSANGQSDEINNNMIDGMDNNERLIGSVGVRPSIDAIDQVKVLTNLYTAEISRTGGGVVDLITKAGGNQFHGTLYEFVRNDKFDAKDYFAPAGPAPELRQNQFGGSIGGPILKQKLFFFFDYENFRQVKGITYTSTVPTLYEEQNPGDFTDLGDNCAKITNVDPIGLNYLKLYPAPNKAVPVPGGQCAVPTANYVYNAGLTMFTRTYDGRGDYHISNSDSIFGRYTQNGLDMYNPGFFPLAQINGTTVNPGAGAGGANFAGPAMDKESSAAVGWTHVFTPNLILDLKAQYLRIDNETKTVNSGQATADLFGFPAGTVNVPGDEISSGIPNIAFNSQGYAGLGDADWVPLIDLNNTFQYLGAVSWVRGKHIFKLGAGVLRRQALDIQSGEPRGDASINSLDPNIPGGAVYNADGSVKHYGNDLAVLLSGLATDITRGYTVLNPAFRSWEPSVYAQDDWRAFPNLTLNLGVRYDIYTPYADANKAFSNFDFSKWLLVGPGLPGDQKSNSTADVNIDYGDVAPRVGFAWTVHNGLVIRGGYGMTYYPGNEASGSFMKNAPGAFNFSCGDKNTPISATVGCSDNSARDYGDEATGAWKLSKGLPVPVVNMSLATDPSTYPSQGTFAITDFNIKSSFLHQFSLNVEKDFSGNVVTVAYVGNRGGRLVQNGVNVNRRPYYDPANPNNYPYYTFIGSTGLGERASNLNSNYNALQLSLQRRMKNGLAANANYTWSHNLTNGQVLDEGNGVGNCYGACHMDDGNGGTVIVNSNVQYDYGNADLDTRHRMSLTFNYDLPIGNTLTGPAALIVKGWSVNAIYYAQTGNPINIGSSTNNTVVYGGQRPNQSTGSSSFKKSLDEWYDVTQFTAPHGYLLGNAHRNSLFGPGTQALSFSIFKSFPVMEWARLQFRAEAFNLLNTPTFANPNTTIYYDASGRGEPSVNGTASITSTTAASTPRQLQLALKLIF
jgi:hypothetical protein